MIYRRLQQGLLMLSGLLIVAGIVPKTRASSNSIFIPYLEQIKTKLAPGLLLRLPAEIPSIDTVATQSNYRVRVSPSLAAPGITVSVFNCKLESQACLVGSFAVNSPASSGDREDFREHQNLGVAISLDRGRRGYILVGQKQSPIREFSSVMWEQDGLLYRVRLRSPNPDNIVAVASSMAQAPTIDELANYTATINNTNTTSTQPELPAKYTNQTTPTSPDTQHPTPTTQTPPNQVSFVPTNNNPIPEPKPTNQTTPDTRHPTSETPAKTALTTPIRLVKITGNTVLGEDKLKPIVEQLEDKDFTQQELEAKVKEVTDRITELYLSEGYVTSKAKPIEPKTINNGVVDIKVVEGRLAEIKVEGTQRLQSYVRSRIQLGTGNTINTAKIEDQLRLLKQDPLFKDVRASLRAANKEGESILIVTVKEAAPFAVNASIDNNSPPTVGSEKAGVGLTYRNLTGLGDQVSAFYNSSFTGGSRTFDFAYRVPLNPMNGTLQLRTILNWSKITQAPFDELNITGDKQVYELSYRQPLVRTPTEEFALSLGFIYDNGQTFTFDKPTPFGIGPDDNGVSRTSVIKIGQDYLRRDKNGAWIIASQFNIGTGLFDATKNDAPTPDGYFISWLTQAQRWQRFGNKNSLIVQADVQLTPNTLLPSQQFVIGGGQSVRGYRQNARSGDNGIRLAVEDRIAVVSDRAGIPKLQIAPFLDLGLVWNVAGNPNPLATQSFLAGAGLGIIWQPFKGLTFRLDYAYPFVNLEDRGNNIQDQGLYFNVNYQP